MVTGKSIQSRCRTVSVRHLIAIALTLALLPLLAFAQENYRQDWAHSQFVYLNTTPTGADVAEDQYDFPVLIRLDKSNFTRFGQVKPGGADIRFADAYGAPLSYQIERWVDNANNNDSAWIWVRTSVKGNDKQQYIVMFWGNGAAVDSSNGPAVFSNNYKGVWHLAEKPGVAGNGFKNSAFADTFHGTGFGFVGTESAESAVGRGVELNGVDQYVTMPPLGIVNANSRTISGWVKGSSTALWTTIFGFSPNPASGRYSYEYAIDASGNYSLHFSRSASSTVIPANDGQWHYLAASYNGNKYFNYVDGVKVGEGSISLLTKDEFMIGHNERNGLFFAGAVDEISVANAPRSAAWIKLSFENQKAAQTLVSFENYADWSKKHTLIINTTSLGAGVPAPIENFPLLVRLHPGNFSGFASTQSKGMDIRFAKSDGTPIPYEIERWRDVAGDKDTADIWVKMDTINGNGETRFVLYAGNPDAVDRSNSSAVFDAASTGYAGLWHLAEPPNTTADGYLNSTSNLNHGTGFNMTETMAGISGPVQKFDGSSSYINVGNVSNLDMGVSNFTLAAWVYPTAMGGFQEIIGKKTINSKGYLMRISGNKLGYEISSVASTTGAKKGVFTGDSLVDSVWQHVAIVFNKGQKASGYINGMWVGDIDNIAKKPAVTNITNVQNFQIGRRPNDHYFSGGIDEPSVSKTLRSTGWIRLAYQTQKPGDPDRSCVYFAGSVKPTRITAQPADLTVLPGPASIGLQAEGSGTLNFTWYKGSVSELTVLQGQTTNILSFVGATTSDDGTYYCVVEGLGGRDTSRAVRFIVESAGDLVPVNPIQLSGTLVDSTHVRLSIRKIPALEKFKNSNPFQPWRADSILIWYKTSAPPANPPSGKPQIKIPLYDLIDKMADPYDTTVKITRDKKAGSCYDNVFLATVKYGNIDGKTDSVMSFNSASTHGATILMCDNRPIPNPLTIAVKHTAPSDEVEVTLGKLKEVERDRVKSFVITYTLSGSETVVDSIAKSRIGSSLSSYSKTYKDARFNSELRPVEFQVVLVGYYGNKSENEVKVTDTVGIPRPKNPIVLNINSDQLKATRMNLFWERPAEPVDSIKVWYESLQVPLHHTISEETYRVARLSGSDTTVTITGLRQMTNYYFGAQVKRQGLWSTVTEASRVQATTLELLDTLPIDNVLSLTEVAYDTLENRISFSWSVDTAGLELEAGIIWSSDSTIPLIEPDLLPGRSHRVVTIADPSVPTTYTLDMASTDIEFEKEYHFWIFLRKIEGKWARPTAASKGKLTIPAASWQPIFIFKDKDTVSALGGRLTMIRGSEKDSALAIDALVRLVDLPAVSKGCIPVSAAIVFEGVSRPPPLSFSLGLRYDSIPAGFSPRDVRMYTGDTAEGQWHLVATDPEIDETRGRVILPVMATELDLPFVLMIDTEPPQVKVTSDTAAIIQPGQTFQITCDVSDNIANPSVKLLSSRADSPLETILPNEDGSWTVPDYLTQGDVGIRVLLVVDDGRFSDTMDISRDMAVSIADQVSPPMQQWIPLAVTTALDDPSVPAALRQIVEAETPWAYDKTLFRLFRWVNEDWLEYDDTVNGEFRFLPGRVIWLKSRKSDPLNLGSGRTVSLKTNVTVAVPAGGWADFSLPYRFPIRVADILSATGSSEGLVFYRWHLKEGEKIYTLEKVYDPADEAFANADYTLQVKDGRDYAYSVLNTLDSDITLRIPPQAAGLSDSTGGSAKRTASGAWSVAIMARSNDGAINPVYCGYTSEGTGIVSRPLGPSWNTVTAALRSPLRKGMVGSVVTSELENGGFSCELIFKNDQNEPQNITCSAKRLLGIPENSSIAIIDPVTGKVENGEGEFTVQIPGNGSEYRWLAIGSQDYIKSMGVSLHRGAFALLSVAPNPFRGSLRIDFQLPSSGFSAVQCEIIDNLGRVVWKTRESGSLQPGRNRMVWKTGERRRLAAGAYLIRLTGFDERGKIRGRKQAKIMYLP